MVDIPLEPPLLQGAKWTALMEITGFDETQNLHAVRLALKGHRMFYQGSMPAQATIVLVIDASFSMQEDKWVVVPNARTEVLPRPSMSVAGLKQVVELCSGMGCLGYGLAQAGFEVCLRNDCNVHMLKLAQLVSDKPVLLGNLADDTILGQACRMAPNAGVLASGISCQPYSKLGDQGAQKDPRSATLPGTLRFGFLGRYAIILMECVQEAKECSYVQTTIARFAAATGYRISQGELHLQAVWPTRRSRWWCILSHPMLGEIPWNPFPQVKPLPLVAHVLDNFKTCNAFELKNLMLDLYELGRFGHAGFDKNEVQWNG